MGLAVGLRVVGLAVVGRAVGIAEGFEDGIGVGLLVGLSDGNEEGMALSLGAVDGLGLWEGLALRDGLEDGCLVGTLDGLALGDEDGFAVGIDVKHVLLSSAKHTRANNKLASMLITFTVIFLPDMTPVHFPPAFILANNSDSA